MLDSPPASPRVPKTYLHNRVQPSRKELSTEDTTDSIAQPRMHSSKEGSATISKGNVYRHRNRHHSATRSMDTLNNEHKALPEGQTPHVSGRPPPYPTRGFVSRAVRALKRDHQMEFSELDFGIRQPYLASSSPAPVVSSPRNSGSVTDTLSPRAPRPNDSRRSSTTRSPRSRGTRGRRVSSANENSDDVRLRRTEPNDVHLDTHFSTSRRRRAGSVAASETGFVERCGRPSRTSRNDSLAQSGNDEELNLISRQSTAESFDGRSLSRKQGRQSTEFSDWIFTLNKYHLYCTVLMGQEEKFLEGLAQNSGEGRGRA